MAEKIGDDMITHGIKIKRPAIPTKVHMMVSVYFIPLFFFILFCFGQRMWRHSEYDSGFHHL